VPRLDGLARSTPPRSTCPVPTLQVFLISSQTTKADTLGLKATFYGAQFHFHSQSEHTINNVRYDFEMHTVHLPGTENTYVEGGLNKEAGYFGSVQGIIFDTKNYDESVTPEEVDIIDSFFESLQMD